MRKFAVMVVALALCGLSGGWTRVTANRPDVPANEAFAELAKQGAVQFASAPAGEKRLAMDFNETPFWEAAISLADQLGQSMQMATLSSIDRNVTFIGAGPSIARTTNGPLTIVLESAIAREHAPGTRELAFRVYADPSLKFFSFFDPVELKEVRDATGKSLLMPRDPEQLAPSPSLITTHRAVIREPKGTLIAFRGSFTVLVAENSENWPIPVNASGVMKRLGKTTYTVKSIRPAAGGYELQAQIKGPADGGFKGGVVPMMLNDQALQMADSSGRRWRITGVEARYVGNAATGIGSYEATLKLQPTPGAAAPSSLTWLIPTQVSTVEARFEFKGLKLP